MSSHSIAAAHPQGDEARRLPLRSKLYCLEPLGLATAEVESATSYLSRLAIAHTVSIWSLLKREIAPSLYGPGVNLTHRVSELISTVGPAFNGENSTSRKLIAVLQSLTGRPDLNQTTMRFCRGFVSPGFLIRRKQAWCSDCLSEWKAKDRPLYSPLIWHLAAVEVCPLHGAALRTTCPTCNRWFYPLAAHSQPGYCPHCRQWLGSSENTTNPGKPGYPLERQIAQRVSDFLQNGPEALAAATASAFAGNVESFLKCSFGGNNQACARFLGVTRYTVGAWESGKQLPTLLSLADFSRRVKVAPEVLVCSHLRAIHISPGSKAVTRTGHRRLFAPRKHDLEYMRKKLEEAVTRGVFPALSLKAISAQVGCQQSTLVRRFPELAKRVKDLHRQFCANRKTVRAQQICSQIKLTVIDIHKMGIYPSMRTVRQRLPTFINMRDPLAYAAWKRALEELGLACEEQIRDAA